MRKIVVGAAVLVVFLVVAGLAYRSYESYQERKYEKWLEEQDKKINRYRESARNANVSILETLDGVVESYNGEMITGQLWKRMTDINASNPAVAGYIKLVGKLLLPGYFERPYHPDRMLRIRLGNASWIDFSSASLGAFFQRDALVTIEPPNQTQLVRIGAVDLPGGMRMIVTAYQRRGHINVLIHEYPANLTEYTSLIARMLAAEPWTFTYQPKYDYYDTYYSTPYSEAFEHAIRNINESGVSMDWILWETGLVSTGAYLDVNGEKVPFGYIYVMAEMPAYYLGHTKNSMHAFTFEAAEWIYWDLVEPAIGLAYNLVLPPNANITAAYDPYLSTEYHYYKWGGNDPVVFVHYFAGTNATPKDDGGEIYKGTPLTLNLFGSGVCNEYSRAYSMMATNAVGMATANVIIIIPHVNGHEISTQFLPGKYYNNTLLAKNGYYVNLTDLDGDGKTDTGYILIDTAILGNGYINELIHNWSDIYLQVPLFYYDNAYIDMDPHWQDNKLFNQTWEGNDPKYLQVVDAVTGIPQAIYRLPDWLHTPWLKLFDYLIQERIKQAANYTANISTENLHIAQQLLSKYPAITNPPLTPLTKAAENLTTIPTIKP